jgi:hypothetical protein
MFSPLDLLADLTIAGSGARPRPHAPVAVRPYPYPYVAAFALSNDVDGMNRAAFEDWHGFVNGAGDTSYGPGLGLEVSDSFWVWSGTRNEALAVYRQYPDELKREESPDVPRITELARAGWLDTLHSFGNWRAPLEGNRESLGARAEAEYALETLDRLGIKPKVFVNHSMSPSNLGGIWGTYQKADDPNHPMYCVDLLKAAGFRYFWIDSCLNMEKFGDHLHYADERDLQAAIAIHPWTDLLRRPGKVLDDDPPDFPTGAAELRGLLVGMFNETILPLTARDGAPILAFKRYRSPYLPTTSTFPIQVTARKLDRLESQGGAVIVYQHFGITSLRGRAKSTAPGAKGRSTPPVFDEHEEACWRDIADRWRAGRLFVATTGRLLDWLWLRDRLVIETDEHADRWTVRLAGLKCSALGERPVETGDLNGLSLLVPETAPEVVVVRGGGAIVPMQRKPDQAHPGRHVLYSPWKSLEWVPPG